MNFLAHLYLSGESDDIKIGNFIADSVKGRNYLNYRHKIQQGIILHRHIDKYTDIHIISKESALFFKEKYSRYSAIVVDIMYDHFLAKNWSMYHNTTLRSYVNHTNILLIKNYLSLPSKIQQILPFMIKSRRLESYANLDEINNVLQIMSRHTSLPDHSKFAINQINNNYYELENMFHIFFKDIIQYIEMEHKIIVKAPIY